MRLAIALALFASPATAWEFSAVPLCTLSHEEAAVSVQVTYDASLPRYAITLTLADGQWPDTATFGIVFDGGTPISIGTDRHMISNAGRTLMVTDSGFGNVLNGLEFNRRAYALAGEMTVPISLGGIGPAMRAFRNCPADALS